MVYSDDQYGLVMYGSDTSDPGDDPDDEKYYTEIRRYLPQFMWSEFREMNALLKAQGYEIGRIWHELEDYYEQIYVDNATWGLKRWEAVLGIRASSSQTYEVRRAAIKARLLACAVCTPALLAQLAESTTGVESSVVEEPGNYLFTIYFVGQYGIPPNVGILRDAVELIKPAHLAVQYKYRYVIWNELLNYTWGSLMSYTWDSIRVKETASYVSWRGVMSAGFTSKSIKKYTWKSIKRAAEAKG